MSRRPNGRTPGQLRAEADRIERRLTAAQGPSRAYTFSHMVMGGIMLTFFAGAGLAAYATVAQGERVTVALGYIMELARIVALGYFIKAFGENIAKIVLSALLGKGVWK